MPGDKYTEKSGRTEKNAFRSSVQPLLFILFLLSFYSRFFGLFLLLFFLFLHLLDDFQSCKFFTFFSSSALEIV